MIVAKPYINNVRLVGEGGSEQAVRACKGVNQKADKLRR